MSAVASNSISLYSTSMAKIAVPIGDRNIADRPAAMPTMFCSAIPTLNSRSGNSSAKWDNLVELIESFGEVARHLLLGAAQRLALGAQVLVAPRVEAALRAARGGTRRRGRW